MKVDMVLIIYLPALGMCWAAPFAATDTSEVILSNRPVRTCLPDGVGTGGEKPPGYPIGAAVPHLIISLKDH
jgi:hypothetical protein